LIVARLEILLKLFNRFYDRQFETRKILNEGVLSKFEDELNTYFNSDLFKLNGIPNATYFSSKLNFSSNYLGDLIKKETGKTILDFIHLKLLNAAKINLLNKELSVSQVVHELGFEYPQHFSRFFKRKTGLTPLEYRKSYKN
jgi:AraC-like DNA-binding protein